MQADEPIDLFILPGTFKKSFISIFFPYLFSNPCGQVLRFIDVDDV